MNSTDSRIRRFVVTPIAISDPPLLNSSGVHEPLALRCVLQLVLKACRDSTCCFPFCGSLV